MSKNAALVHANTERAAEATLTSGEVQPTSMQSLDLADG